VRGTAALIQSAPITYAPLVFTERTKANDTSLTFEQHIQNLQANMAVGRQR